MTGDHYDGDVDPAFPGVVVDAFGVPSNLMGVHPEEFFSLLGRIVALSALLENQVLVFYQHLVGSSQDQHTELSVSWLIQNALEELSEGRLPGPTERTLAERFLLEAQAITHKRNDYVHNLWPAQGNEQLVGWRMLQKKNAKAALMMVVSLDEMRGDLQRLVSLLEVNGMNRLRALVADGRHRRNEAGDF